MSYFLKNFFKIQNIGLFFLLLTPIAFIVGSLFANIFTILLFIIYVYYQPKNEIYNFIKKNKYIIIFLFTFTFLNIIFSDAREYSLLKAIPYYRFFIFCISIVFILNAISKNTLTYTKFLFILILFLIVDSYIQLYFGKDIFGFSYQEDYQRITGVFKDEMVIGNFLLYIGFLSIAFVNYFYEVNKYNNFILFLILPITILITGERTSFLSLIYLYTFIFLISKKKKFILLLSISLIIFSTIIINFSDRLSNKYSISAIPKLADLVSDIKLEESNKLNSSNESNEKSDQESFIYQINLSLKTNKYVGHYSRAIDIFKKKLSFRIWI